MVCRKSSEGRGRLTKRFFEAALAPFGYKLLLDACRSSLARADSPGQRAIAAVTKLAVADLFVIALAIWDFRARGRLHPVTLWGGLLIIASQPLRLVVSSTEGWLVFAQWATVLLGS